MNIPIAIFKTTQSGLSSVRFSSESIGLFTILLLGGWLRFVHITIGFPDLYGYDEIFEVHRALELLRLEYDFYRTKGVYYQLLAVIFGFHALFLIAIGQMDSLSVYVSHFIVHPNELVFMSRVLTASLGTLSIYLMYLLGKRIFQGEFPGPRLMLALAWAICWLPVWLAKFGIIETLLMNLGISSIFYILNLLHEQSWKNYLLCGVLIGTATATKLYGILLFCPLVIAHCLAGGTNQLVKTISRLLDKRFLVSIGVFFLTVGILSPSILLNYLKHGLSKGTIPWQPTMETAEWFPLEFYMNIILESVGYLMAPIFMVGFLVSIILWRKDILICGAFAVLFLASFGLRPESVMIYDRYMLMSLPFFWVVTVYGIEVISQRVQRYYSSESVRRVVRGGGFLCAALIVTWNSVEVLAEKKPMIFQDSYLPVRQIAVRWFVQNVPSGSKVLLRGEERPWPGNQTLPIFDLKENYWKKYEKVKSRKERGVGMNFLLDLAEANDVKRYNLVTLTQEEEWESPQDYIARGVQYFIIDSVEFPINPSGNVMKAQETRRNFYQLLLHSKEIKLFKQFKGKNPQGKFRTIEIYQYKPLYE